MLRRTSPGPPPVYLFEDIDGRTLPLMPLAARRALDVLGRKLSLKGWLSLSLEDRVAVVRAGADERVDEAAAALCLARANPEAAEIEPAQEPASAAVPAVLGAALGPAHPLDDELWRSLHPLDRYALVKTAGKAERLAAAYTSIVARLVASPSPTPALTHLTSVGEAHIVDAATKPETQRRAVASACVRTTREVIQAVASATMPKGDVLAVARVAGILAAKGTPGLLPLCPAVRTTSASVDFEALPERGELHVRAAVEAVDRTGVEMEAMVAASVAALTVYDMIKSADRWATIEQVRLEEKRGGKSGVVRGRERASEGASDLLVALREAPLNVDEARLHVEHPGAGATCVFVGTVRDTNEGRAVVALEYEAYPSMALAEMRRIAEELAAEAPGVRLAVIHRTGSLAVGDAAVVCAASAPHRDEAYRACRGLIDRVKARVPIWKREHGPEGAYWVGWRDARCPDEGHHPEGLHGDGHDDAAHHH
jgi:molybdenum cofactor biosynthesis protein MoaC